MKEIEETIHNQRLEVSFCLRLGKKREWEMRELKARIWLHHFLFLFLFFWTKNIDKDSKIKYDVPLGPTIHKSQAQHNPTKCQVLFITQYFLAYVLRCVVLLTHRLNLS